MQPPAPSEHNPQFAGLDLLVSAVVLLDDRLCVRYCNPAAEALFNISRRSCLGQPLARLLSVTPSFVSTLEDTLRRRWSYTKHDIVILHDRGEPLHLDCSISPLEIAEAQLLLEFRPIDQQLHTAREERQAMQQAANRELIRNLAHELKNPLGGIRGSAQLLERELHDPGLRQYTDVIIEGTDRLQALMRRLLSPHQAMQPTQLNIHEVLEATARLIRAEFPGVHVRRDYDVSLPELTGDREQLLQVALNIMRNAAQAVDGRGEILLRTRIRRQATLAKKCHRLVLELQIIDDGPGVPEEIRERIFYPLVSARTGGTGVGLALAHDIVQQHQGSIELESAPGRTCFTVRLPLLGATAGEGR